MRMLIFTLTVVTASLLMASANNHELRCALLAGAEFDVRLRIVDDEHVPVEGARCSGWIYLERDGNHGCGYTKYTDTNGCVCIVGKCSEWLRVIIRKEGYYRTMFEIKYPNRDVNPFLRDGKWQPYGEKRTVVLKRKKNLGQLSVPDMGVLPVRERKIPQFDCWLPFDLEKFDWTAPYGKGVCSDVLLRLHNRTTSNFFDYTDRMEICFTNNPFAGVYEVEKDAFSDMKTVYVADSNAVYKSQLTIVCERTSDNKRTENYLKEDAYLVFRTRTVVDEQGKLKSAHYGVIYGPWLSAGDHVCFTDGCFNPRANDLNIEDSYYLREEVRHYNGSNKSGTKCER